MVQGYNHFKCCVPPTKQWTKVDEVVIFEGVEQGVCFLTPKDLVSPCQNEFGKFYLHPNHRQTLSSTFVF